MFRIAHIEPMVIAVPMVTPIRMSIGTITKSDDLIVRITDGQGHTGWGEAASAAMMTGETSPGMVAAVRFMAERLEGREVTGAEAIADLIEATMHADHAAKSAIDTGLLDLAGQHLGLPLHEVLGGKKRERAAMIWRISGAPDEIETARAAREVVGLGPRVSVDANEGFSPPEALLFVKGAGDAGLDFFEQPVAGHDLEAMCACVKAASIPIGADEGLHGPRDITSWVRRRQA